MRTGSSPGALQFAEARGTYSLSGCRAVPMTEAERAAYEGRMAYWDGELELAWEVHDHSRHHEGACVQLGRAIDAIAQVRGTPIELLRSTDLQERNAAGKRLHAAQADELVYLDRKEGPQEDVVLIGRSPLPDVLVEVDLTTDVRDRKLKLYAEWGIPELWVEVPDAEMRSKRKRRGLTVYILKDGEFRKCAESKAFPTWTADEIHRAMNEPVLSAATAEALRRVGGVMGQAAGTGPDDDPLLNAHGRSKHREGQLATVENIFASRRVPVAGRLADDADWVLALPNATIVDAALQCRDYDDFLSRLRAEGR